MNSIREIIDSCLDSDELCLYCVHHEYCDGGIKCYGGEPIFPPCADGLPEDDFDLERYLEDMGEKDEI